MKHRDMLPPAKKEVLTSHLSIVLDLASLRVAVERMSEDICKLVTQIEKLVKELPKDPPA